MTAVGIASRSPRLVVRWASMLMLTVAGLASAQSGEVTASELERAMESRITVKLEANTPLPEALQSILVAAEAADALSIAPNALAYLPDGRNTGVAGTLRDVPLGSALSAILRPMGLTHTVTEDGRLRVEPGKLLERMNRRLSWQEFRMLRTLAQHRYEETDGNPVLELEFDFDTADEPLPAPRFSAAMLGADGDDAIAQLNDATDELGWVWRLTDDAVLLTSRSVQYARDLDLTAASATYENADVSQIIGDLAETANVPLHLEAGVFTTLPDNARTLTMNLRNASIRDALERISASTGLRYSIDNEGLHIASADENADQRNRPRLAFILPVTLPDGTRVEMLVTEDELSDEAKSAYRRIRAEHLKALEGALLAGELPKDVEIVEAD